MDHAVEAGFALGLPGRRADLLDVRLSTARRRPFDATLMDWPHFRGGRSSNGRARAGVGNSPRTLLTELRELESVDVVLPTADMPAREIRLRCAVRPEKAQADLLGRLELRLPSDSGSPDGPRGQSV